jgi:hypothetical protein
MGNSVKVLTMDILEEEVLAGPPVDRCTMRLGKIDWDGAVLIRRYQRSLPIFSFYPCSEVVLDQLAKVYFYGPHSTEMYGRILSEARAPTWFTSTRFRTRTTSSGTSRHGWRENES